MDNRLDFINHFQAGGIEKMTEMRKKFIALDNELRELIIQFVDEFHKNNEIAPLARAVANARTHLETALSYAIKSICLKYEKKGD